MIGGPGKLDNKDRFKTCSRAANSQEPTPLDLKYEEARCLCA